VEERIAEIKNAAEDAIASMRNAMKTKMVRLPKAVRSVVLVGWPVVAGSVDVIVRGEKTWQLGGFLMNDYK